MNTIGIALVWCVVQVTLLGILAGGLYLLVERLRPLPPRRSPSAAW